VSGGPWAESEGMEPSSKTRDEESRRRKSSASKNRGEKESSVREKTC
jgi:hypothetical protein